MPRQARLDAPGALHHVMGRGIEGVSIFRSDEDREDFLTRLGALCEAEALSVHAWALLDNHFHLLIRTGKQRISEGMRKLLTGYVVRFNRRYGRYGHLFQNRYKSILCEEDPYLLELTRYIHLNPVRAGVARCGHRSGLFWEETKRGNEEVREICGRRGGDGKASGVGGRRVDPEHGGLVGSGIIKEEGRERGFG